MQEADENKAAVLDQLIALESLLNKAVLRPDEICSGIKECGVGDARLLLSLKDCKNHIDTALDIVRYVENRIRFGEE
jgi:hypothetical protein